MKFLEWTVTWTLIAFALSGCAFAWWFWTQAQLLAAVPRWRRIAAKVSLFLISASIAFGAFAWIYWMRSAEPGPGPPKPTFISTYVGFFLVAISVPVLLCAKGRTRAMLLLSSVGLFGFYFLMFLSP
jgi:hypothetical protein